MQVLPVVFGHFYCAKNATHGIGDNCFFSDLSGSWQKSERHGALRFLAWRLDSTQLNTCVCVQVAPAPRGGGHSLIWPIRGRAAG